MKFPLKRRIHWKFTKACAKYQASKCQRQYIVKHSRALCIIFLKGFHRFHFLLPVIPEDVKSEDIWLARQCKIKSGSRARDRVSEKHPHFALNLQSRSFVGDNSWNATWHSPAILPFYRPPLAHSFHGRVFSGHCVRNPKINVASARKTSWRIQLNTSHLFQNFSLFPCLPAVVFCLRF